MIKHLAICVLLAAPAFAAPPQEVADMAKSMTGTWKCDGTSADTTGKMQKMKATLTTKADLDGFWVHDSFVGGADKGPKFKMESFSTYDAGSKKWRRITLMNDGGQMTGTSEGMKDMKMDFVLDSTGPMGAGQFKDHIDAGDMKKGVHAWGEMSMDKGKTWLPVYDMVCKK